MASCFRAFAILNTFYSFFCRVLAVRDSVAMTKIIIKIIVKSSGSQPLRRRGTLSLHPKHLLANERSAVATHAQVSHSRLCFGNSFLWKKDKSFSLCCACFPSKWHSSVNGLIAENLVA